MQCVLGIATNTCATYIYAFSRRFYPKQLTVHSGYTCFISMCVPWELNPQPFALLTQCSTTEPQEHLWTRLMTAFVLQSHISISQNIFVWHQFLIKHVSNSFISFIIVDAMIPIKSQLLLLASFRFLSDISDTSINPLRPMRDIRPLYQIRSRTICFHDLLIFMMLELLRCNYEGRLAFMLREASDCSCPTTNTNSDAVGSMSRSV